MQILHLFALGESHKAIAGKLEISERTVDFHSEHIRRKIKKPTIAAAIFAIIFFVP